MGIGRQTFARRTLPFAARRVQKRRSGLHSDGKRSSDCIPAEIKYRQGVCGRVVDGHGVSRFVPRHLRLRCAKAQSFSKFEKSLAKPEKRAMRFAFLR